MVSWLKVGTVWYRGMVEQSCSLPGTREAEHRERETARDTPASDHILQGAPLPMGTFSCEHQWINPLTTPLPP